MRIYREDSGIQKMQSKLRGGVKSWNDSLEADLESNQLDEREDRRSGMKVPKKKVELKDLV